MRDQCLAKSWFSLAVPWFLGELAEGLRSIGRFDEALDVVRDALHQDRKIRGTPVRGGALSNCGQLGGSDRLVEAENSFRRAIEIARLQGAKMWELRASTSLAQLLDTQSRRDEMRAMLANVYGWFTEGLDTADLKEAKALFDNLSA